MHAPALYRLLLHAYPAEFRREYGTEMADLFAVQLAGARGSLHVARLWRAALADLVTIAPKEHVNMFSRNIRYALRTLAANPGFAMVAILSLGLGIGANTAIFSLWNGVIRSTLPVADPAKLIILTDPAAAGVSIGKQGGDRSLLTFAEFQGLRDLEVFSGLMATQSALGRWDVRIAGGAEQEVRGRLVSSSYFDVLGVAPLLGRGFQPSDSASPEPSAVISYDFWQRQFGGRPEALGATIATRKATLTITGVMPRSFFGETAGQRPDVWMPLAMQPSLIPGRDWLHDTGSNKVMWLHVFARLAPGVTMAQAQDRTNASFKNALASHYGSVLPPDVSRGFLNQSIRIRDAATGASTVRARFGEPIVILLAGVAVILLIACANIANLLVARGAARQREIALRLILGAGKGRIIRQLLTESLVLATAGGLMGVAMAFVLHRGLVYLVSGAVESFALDFQLDLRVLAFAFAVTAAASLFFGLIPAWIASRASPGAGLQGQSRTSTGSASQMRFGRSLVAAQLALSLPLLVGAGLLVRTLHNLRNADLGYQRENIVTFRLDAQTAGYKPERRADLYLRVLDQIRLVPGVRAASFSGNGLFTGRNSGDNIEVEGYTPKGNQDRGSSWDQAGPGFFETLGIPILLGRDFNEADRAAPTGVCIVNEAFAKVFFAGPNPLGLRITTVYGDERRVHHVIGVARDARMASLRREIGPRYWVPITQPLAEFGDVTYEVRTSGESAAAMAGIRRAIESIDASLPLADVQNLTGRLERSTGQDRMMAFLAAAFGAAALTLTAIGLYGILSYGVARRRGEIGIRIALGAQKIQVISMILRETAAVTALGMTAGAGLAYAAAKVLRSQLYGIDPADPLTIALAFTLLAATAIAAAWLPARRAAELNPLSALRQD